MTRLPRGSTRYTDFALSGSLDATGAGMRTTTSPGCCASSLAGGTASSWSWSAACRTRAARPMKPEPQDGSEQRERVPLHHVDPMGFDAEIRRRPRANEPVVGNGRGHRLDHDGQYAEARGRGKARRV